MKSCAGSAFDKSRQRSSCHFAKGDGNEPSWNAHLPAEWHDAVDAPLYFHCYREYEMHARRAVGYDTDDQPCFTTYSFALTRLVSNDDEEFYEEISCSELLAAWRLRDERWLIFRQVRSDQCEPTRGFYSIAPSMPR
jgi:hypothetical protein